jgi:capsular exopolysaccharide synthesis family protein
VQQDSEAFNLERVLGVLRRYAPLILLCVVVVAGAAFGFSKRQTKKYTASASLNFSTNPLSQQIAGLPGSSANNSSTLLAQEASNVEAVKGGDTAARTAALIQHGLTKRRVVESLSFAGQGETPIVVISATTTSPVLSARIVNIYAEQFVKNQQTANLGYFKSARAIVQKQLAALSPQQKVGPVGVALQNRAQTLSLLAELKVGNVAIASEALPPTSPSSPKTSRNTALGIVAGLLIGIALALALERFDRRVRTPEEFEALYRLPLLGEIPQSSALARSAREKGRSRSPLPPAEAEGFSLLRARLRFFDVDRELRTIVVASAEPGDGKSMVARHLAEAAARLGSRVLLLEVDLRQPTLGQQLGISAGPGLADVLIGAIAMAEATKSVDLDPAPGEGAKGRTLDVLPAGAVLPPNPGELLDSQAMDAVLAHARSKYDLVVIDTPPLRVVSDAFALLTKVDGIIIVGRVGRSRRHPVERLHQVLASSGATLLGVIANGSKLSGPSVYPYARKDPPAPAVGSVNGASPADQPTTPTFSA